MTHNIKTFPLPENDRNIDRISQHSNAQEWIGSIRAYRGTDMLIQIHEYAFILKCVPLCRAGSVILHFARMCLKGGSDKNHPKSRYRDLDTMSSVAADGAP